MSLYYCLVPKMANAVVLWVIVYFCVTSVNTKDIPQCSCFFIQSSVQRMYSEVDASDDIVVLVDERWKNMLLCCLLINIYRLEYIGYQLYSYMFSIEQK